MTSYSVHRPASGAENVGKHAISSTNVDMLDQQMYVANGYDNSGSYHNRHATTHLYGVSAGNPPGSASNQNRPQNFRDQSSSSASNLMKQPINGGGSSNSNNMNSILMSAG